MGLFDKATNGNEPQGETSAMTQDAPLLGMSVAELANEYEKVTGEQAVSAAKGQIHIPSAATPPVTQKEDQLRPRTLDDFQGQERIKGKIAKYMKAAMVTNKPLMHVLLTAKAGQGKTTLAEIIGNEMGVNVFWEGCPIHRERLLELQQEMQDGDILMLDEVHLQTKTRQAGASPEMLYHVMEDFRIVTLNQGIIDFPQITVIGATTDVGLLPDSFKERFPLKITFEEYTDDELANIARFNARVLDVGLTDEAANMMARASLAVPREVNNLMKQAGSLAQALGDDIDADLTAEVLYDDGREPDGLKREMMAYLEGLWERRRWSESKGEWRINASLTTMAHVIGRARDKKTVENDIEPILVKRNLIDIGPGGRTLTPQGMERIGVEFPPPPDGWEDEE